MDQFEELDTLFDQFGLSELDASNSAVCSEAEPTEFEGWDDSTETEEAQEITSRLEKIQDYVENTNVGDNVERAESESDSETEVQLTDNISCTCKVNCLNQFDSAEIQAHILSLREMEKEQKEMFILGALQRIGGEETRKGKRRRIRYRYIYNGKTVCKTVFCHINDTGKRTLKSLQKHLSLNGFIPRVHGNTGRKPHHALRYEEVKYCVDFLVAYADLHGLPMPAAPRGKDEEAPVLLPSALTKAELHKEYSRACAGVVVRSLGLTSFKDVWRNCVPHIKIMSPHEDVCSKCEMTRKRITAATSENEKLNAATTLRDHIQDAQTEREQYKASVLEAGEEMYGYERPDGPIPPLSTDFKKVHYTFDYSQGVFLPQYSQQMGPLYFVTRRKIQIFGIRLDSVSHQYNYLIDENQTIGMDGKGTHGSDSVLSMLHHCLYKYGFGEKSCVMHADNCAGQNKNRYVLAYLCWRIHQGLHSDIILQMQVPGHTKCLVDSGFGHIKKLFRRSDCDSVEQLADVVAKSAKSNSPVLYRTDDGEQNWTWYDWKSFLQEKFLPLKGIRKYHVFRFTDRDKRAVYVKTKSGAPEVRIELVKRGAEIRFGVYPEMLRPAGLSAARQEYLYKNVRQFVRPESRDLLCPVPPEE